MFEAEKRIAYLSKVANEKKDLRFKDLYKMLCQKEFLEYAYGCIKGNKGSKTAGVDEVTKEMLSSVDTENMMLGLSNDLFNEKYQPLPVRRTEIPKGYGKAGKRPLGIPALKDRIVQSATKLILETIYEPLFLDTSHGFRPKRSCQTAINSIILRSYDWVVEGDIKGCFDNIKHGKLLNILRKRIADEKFINLIRLFLKSGYQMGFGLDGKHPVFQTKNGTTQGGIVSPVLANIYLHEFDTFIQGFIKTINDRKYKRPKQYEYYHKKVTRIRKSIREGKLPYKIQRLSNEVVDGFLGTESYTWLRTREDVVKAYRAYKKLRSETSHAENYFDIKGLGYVRYADDFVVLMAHYSKEDARQFKEMIANWFEDNLELTLSLEKTKITHSTDGFTFLGYDMMLRPKEKGLGFKDDFARIYIPSSKIDKLKDKLEKVFKLHHNTEPYDLIAILNRIISGWSNYYKIANNWHKVANKMDYFVHWKLMHWLARKHKSSIPKMHKKYSRKFEKYGCNVKRQVVTAGNQTIALTRFSDYKYTTTIELVKKISKSKAQESWFKTSVDEDAIDKSLGMEAKGHSFKEFHELSAESGKKCSKCGKTEVKLIVHHKRLVKRAQKKDIQATKQSAKELPKELLCETCHNEAHPNTKTTKQL